MHNTVLIAAEIRSSSIIAESRSKTSLDNHNFTDDIDYRCTSFHSIKIVSYFALN